MAALAVKRSPSTIDPDTQRRGPGITSLFSAGSAPSSLPPMSGRSSLCMAASGDWSANGPRTALSETVQQGSSDDR